MITSESINELAGALAKAQGAMEGASKGTANPFFKSRYSDLASVMQAIRQPFAESGLCFVQGASYESGHVLVTTRIMHASGQWIEDTLTVPVSKADAQGVGSALSYGKRYSLQALAGVPSIDDDGEAAVSRQAPAPVVTADQASILKATIEKLDVDVAKFCGAFAISSVDQLPAAQFGRASAMLAKRGGGK
jgi:hypothetical protein